MVDVLLIQPPYSAVERPSIALGILKQSLSEAGVDSEIIYANLLFAEQIGLRNYNLLYQTSSDELAGEWTFSGAAFPDFNPNHDAYLKRLKLQGNQDPPHVIIKMLWSVRRIAGPFIETLARSVVERRPRIVGCSSSFQQNCASLALLRTIRQIDPGIVTVLGGANCEGPLGLATIELFPWLDFVVSGEADELFPELCDQILEQGRHAESSNLPYGVLSRSTSSGIISDPPRAVVQDLDRTPIPDYDEYFRALEKTSYAGRVTPGLLMETSRGCWWGQKHHCSFCGLNGTGLAYRSKSPDRILQELETLSARYGVRRFAMVDNILDMSHLSSVMPSLAAQQAPYSVFYETKANLQRHQVGQLASAGVRWIQPGIESLDDRILGLLNKGSTVLTNIQLLKATREFGIRLSWNFLCGVPGEKDEWYSEMAGWLPAIAHLQPPEGFYSVRYDRFSPYYERPDDHGISIEPALAYRYVYPFPAAELSRLAFYFQDRLDEWELPLSDRLGAGPGLRSLERAVALWTASFTSSAPAHLRARDDGKALHLQDTRPCTVESRLRLTGLARRIYRVCDIPQTPRSLLRALKNSGDTPTFWLEVEPLLEELLASKVVLNLNGKYISLALSGACPPLPRLWEFPGGWPNEPRRSSPGV